uniref:AT hook containing transcription factor 1 n=1 Tax=Electrophorus electricus TaxID=8005 RepID=A0AAY5EQ46_ELEEL
MRDLVAQVTSSLLRFPEVTVEALGEDEVTLDSVLHGRFTTGRGGLAWLSCGPQLEVVHAVTGERLSAYRFTGMAEHPPTVLAVRDFSWLKRCGLLVGLEEEEGSMLCLYDLGISRVVKAVVIPGRITGIEPLVSYGGASASTQHLHQSLRWFFGVAAVVTDIGHVLLVDLCLDDLSCTQTELEASDLEVVNKSPSEIPRLREGVTQQGRHLCLQLSSPSGTAATSLQYVPRTNHLAVGFSDGYLQLWNMKTLKKEYHSQLEGGRVPVYAFTFQEPENDPRNCCYLWAVQSAQDHEGDIVSLHLLQLAFGERKCLASGKILYEGLEYCEERYSQDLNGTVYPLRAHATNTRLLSCQTIEKYRQHPDREDSMSEVASPDTSVSIFSWQVKSYGQGQPSTFIGIFDINRWYHAQMPDSLRAGESLRNCPYLAVWSLDSVVEMTAPCPLLDVVVHDRSLSRGLAYTCPPPEQFFSQNYNLILLCLLNSGIVHLTCAGYQKETLGYLKKSVPSLSDGISSGYSRCLMSGLLSSRLADVQPSSLSQEEQLDAILMAAVETSSLGMITGCIKQWTTDELPGSAGNLRYILEWAWDRVVRTKEELDRICAPLFDSSSNFTDPQTLQLLQHSQRLLCNISTIFHCMLNEAQELTQRGLVDLMNKSLVSSLISQYAQVVLWFCRTGLLPEVSDDVLQISRPFYSFSVIKNYYIGQREELKRLAKEKWCADCLMIDGLVTQCGERLADLWKRDEGGTGQYPPPSLHALLDLYLLENVDESAKHAIVIYLLLDVMYSFPNKSGASVESFPTAFAIPVGLVKLVQGLWLLDHHDHESSLELLLHPTTSHSLWPWQHGRVLQALMCQGKHNIALRYLHVMKPSMSSTNQAKLCLSVLLHNRCIVEGLALLRQHANKLNVEELMQFLYETCQDLDLMKELLRLPLGPSEQECLERFLQGTGGFQNRELLMVHYLQQANYVPALQINQTLKMNQAADRDPKMKERSNTRNSILSQYGKVLPRAQRKLAIERAKPYHHTTILREVTRPQPLSTVAKRSATETVLTRAAFIKSVLSKIEEVWVGCFNYTPPLHSFSPRELELSEGGPHPPTLHVPEAFIGTPINMLTSRVSRLLDLVVQPSLQTSPEIHTQGTSHRPITAWASPKGITKAPELSLLQTPQVVKRARALASSGPVFTSFTPQSILRSSLRPTPVATPSVSPGRSVTPPLRPKESRITFIEETGSPDLHKSSVHWSNGLAASSEITPLKRPPRPPEGGFKAWSEHAGEEPSLTLMPSLKEKGKPEKTGSQGSFFLGEILAEEPKQILPTLLHRHSLGHETSAGSINSDTTLEFHNALSPGDLVRQALELSAENSVDAEVIVGLPRTAESAKPSADGATEELPAASHPAEEQEPIADEKMNSEEECTGKAHEHSPEVERQMHTNEDELQLDKDITLEEGHEQHMAEEFAFLKDPLEWNARHLFDNDLSPPLTRSGIKEQSEIWASFNSEELSSSESDESGAEENEEEEDSGSEVEIIEEVEGNSRQQLPPTPVLYLQDLPHDEQYLQEQSAAVLSLVAPHTQLKVMDGVVEEEEGEVVVVGLEPANLGEEADGPVCYTELKPSTTLLVPLELAGDHQELLAGGALQALGGKLEEALPGSCNTFSLMLDADGGGGGGDDDEEEEEPVASEPNPEHPLIHQNTKQPEDVESPPVAKTDVPSLEPVGQVPDDQLMEELPSAKFEDVSLGVPCAANADKPAKGPHPEERQPEQMKVDQLHTTAFEPPVERVPCVHLDDRREEADSSAPLSHKEVVDERKAAGETLYKSPMPHREVKLEDGDLPKANKDVVFVAEDLVSAASTVQSSASWDAEFKSFKTSKACESPSKDALSNAETNKEETVAKVKQTELVDSMVPSTPRRVTRSRMQLQDSQVPVTPRRSARKVDLELQNEEEILSTKASKPSASARRTPQKATRRKSSLRSRTTNVAGEVQPVEALLINDMIMPQTRQSARKKPRVSNSPDSEAPVDGDAVPLAGPPPSPSRVTRKSRRGFSLALESFQQEAVEGTVVLQPPVATPTRNKRKTRGSTVEKANITLVVDDAQLQNVSRRLTRSQLWNHEKEPEREPTPVLGTPLHTESVNPLANALMERLKHEGAKKESIAAVTEIARAKRRTTKSAVSSAESNSQNVGVEGSQELESTEIQGTMKRSTASVRRTRASKVHKPDISLDGDSLVFSSSLQRTKGRVCVCGCGVLMLLFGYFLIKDWSFVHHDKIPPDVATEVEKIKMRKRATRTKVSSKPAPPIEIDLLSPLASPAEAVTRTLKREEEKDVPTLKMNLRRKRVMEGIFPRPVTRRKKL